MTRQKKHLVDGPPTKQCGGFLRRLYARDDTGGKTQSKRTDYFLCTRCGKVVSTDMLGSEA